jgi:hypothetical protein
MRHAFAQWDSLLGKIAPGYTSATATDKQAI